MDAHDIMMGSAGGAQQSRPRLFRVFARDGSGVRHQSETGAVCTALGRMKVTRASDRQEPRAAGGAGEKNKDHHCLRAQEMALFPITAENLYVEGRGGSEIPCIPDESPILRRLPGAVKAYEYRSKSLKTSKITPSRVILVTSISASSLADADYFLGPQIPAFRVPRARWQWGPASERDLGPYPIA
jgi:hypothetical protein